MHPPSVPPSIVALFFAACLPCFSKDNPPATEPEAPPPAGVTVLHDVEIGKGGDRPLHAEIAYPSNPTAAPMPAVIRIHGGGWRFGSYKEKVAQWLAPH